MQDLVSVIIPVYNRDTTILRAIKSVLDQDYDNVEVIVVDDASSDNTVDIVRSVQDDRVQVICEDHKGACHARNVGIVHAKGDYIAFQDSDDEWCSNKLAIQIQFMQKNGYLACFCPYYLHDGDHVGIIPYDYNNKELYGNCLSDVLKTHNVIGTPTLILHRKVLSLLRENIFDESLPRLQDYELMIRMIQVTDIGYVDKPLVKAYRMVESITANKLSLYDACTKIMMKHGGFINIASFVNLIKCSGVEYIDPLKLAEDIRKIQCSLPPDASDVKSEIITYLAEQLQTKNYILKKFHEFDLSLLKDQTFVLYGAGVVAREIYGLINRMGLRPDAFLVTTLNGNVPRYLEEIPVLTAESYPDKNILVFVCVSLKYKNEVSNNLLRLGFSNVYL